MDSGKPFKRIVLPLDGSIFSEEAIVHTVPIARACHAEVHLMHVLESRPHGDGCPVDSVDWRLKRAEANSYLNGLVGQFQAAGVTVKIHILEGRPAEQIVEFSEDYGIDLIVFSAYGKGGVTQFRFGSTVQKVISASGVSFMIVRPEEEAPPRQEVDYQRILIPMDGSHRSEWAACQAAALMRGKKAELVLLQVIAVPEMPRRMPMTQEELALRDKFVESNRRAADSYLNEIAEQLQNGIRLRSRLVVAQSVARKIQEVAEEERADLIAMSAHGNQDISLWVTGTVCQAVISHSTRPVLVFQDLPDSQPHRLRAGDESRQPNRLMYAS